MFVKSTVFFVANFKKKVIHKIITCCRKTVIFIEKREKVPQFDSEVSKRIYFKIQVHHVVPMQEGHPSQDLLGQPDHIFFCKGLIVICNALVEDFPPSGTVRRDEEIK